MLLRLSKVALLILTLSFISCDNTEEPQEQLNYLALGDSYTIGESVDETDRWPEQLVDTLIASGLTIERPKIIAKTGWRTDQLKDSINSDPGSFKKYDLVSLLIGVNNQVQGSSLGSFRSQFEELLAIAVNLANGNTERVFVLSVPDYAKTPFEVYLGGDEISQEIAQFNEVISEVCTASNIQFFDITPISEEVVNDTGLIGPDNFHPSGKMYKQWVDLIIGDIINTLSE